MEIKEIDDRGASVSEDQVQENFDAAFDEAQGIGAPGEPPTAKTEAENNQELVDSISPENAKPVKPAENSEPGADPPGKVDPNVADPPANDETAEQKWRTLQGIHKKDKEIWEQREKEYQDKIAAFESGKPPEGKAPTDAKVPADAKDGRSKDAVSGDLALSEEDKAALAEYDQEFDTISKMEGLKRDAVVNQLRKEFTAALQEVIQAIAPAISVGDEVSRSRHFDSIREAHDDFETYRDNGSIKSWIDTKPAYVKAAYEKAYSSGTPEDVIDLISTFKHENNIGTKSPGTPPQKLPANPTREAKKSALSVVTNRRGAVNLSQLSTDDFEGAFDEAMSK